MSDAKGDPEQGWIARHGLALLTDFYEITMLGGYHNSGRGRQHASFDYFFRELPPDAGYAVLAGLEPFLDFCEDMHFRDEDVEYLRSTDTFSESFLESLREFRLTCDITGPPEGSIVFPGEPVLRVEGELSQVQLLETFLLNALNYPTLVASKAARICGVAKPDPVVEFGLRRAQGPDGGLSGSRAAYIGGCSASSNVMAGKAYGIPVSGTMAHSWIMSFGSELEAFREYAKAYPENPILLVDTYDDLESGIPNAIRVFREMEDAGNPQRAAIRLDSGDLAKLSKKAYAMLTEAGFEDPFIIASNELDEDLIADLKRQGAKINGWGVGTHLITVKGSPALNGVYKLAAIREGGEWQPRLKISANATKTTDPGRKRVVRYFSEKNRPIGDVIFHEGETWPETGTIQGFDRTRLHLPRTLASAARCEELGTPLLRNGKRVSPGRSATAIRDFAGQQIDALPEELIRLRYPEIYPVLLSPELAGIKEKLLKEHLGG